MAQVRIEPWHEDDLDLLRQLNSPDTRKHTGGPETDEQVLARHDRYVHFSGTEQGCMFTMVLPDGVRAGSVGYWAREWRDQPVYELGWAVLPAYRGQGLADRGGARGGGRGPRPTGPAPRPRLPLGRQSRLERGVPQGRLHAARRDRFRIPAGADDACQRLAARPDRPTDSELR